MHRFVRRFASFTRPFAPCDVGWLHRILLLRLSLPNKVIEDLQIAAERLVEGSLSLGSKALGSLAVLFAHADRILAARR